MNKDSFVDDLKTEFKSIDITDVNELRSTTKTYVNDILTTLYAEYNIDYEEDKTKIDDSVKYHNDSLINYLYSEILDKIDCDDLTTLIIKTIS